MKRILLLIILLWGLLAPLTYHPDTKLTLRYPGLEKNQVWLSTVITLAPMLGFTGTVWGMVKAFQDISKANDISPTIVADGISMALLTTLFGLIVAMIIQVFQNWFLTRIDKLIIDMEKSSVTLLDVLAEKNIKE